MNKISTQLIISAKNKASAVFKTVTSDIKKTGKAADDQGGKLDAVSADVDKLATSSKKLQNEQKKLDTSSEKLAISEKQVAAQFKKIAIDAKKAVTQEQKLRVEQARLSAGAKSLANDEKRLALQLKQTALNSKIASKHLGKLGRVQKKLAGSSSFLKAKVVGFVSVLGAFGAVFNATKTFQQLNASLKTVTGSTESAEKAFEFISDFAKNTPFQLNTVADAFIKLKALGLDPSEDALTSYGNTAAAMGKDLSQFIEAVADATTNEFERLKEFGIKAKQQGDQVSFTFQGVTTTVGKNAKEIEAFLRGIGNVQFAGAMTEQMKTVGGQLSNLQDAFFTLAVEIGKSGAGDASGSIMTDISNVVKQATQLVKENGATISEAFNGIIGSVRFFGNIFIVVFNTIQILMRGFTKTIFSFVFDVNEALSLITFGETSKEFARNAEAMKETIFALDRDITNDVESINGALSRFGSSFDKTSTKQDKLTKSSIDAAKANKQLTPTIEKNTDALQQQADAANNAGDAQDKLSKSARKKSQTTDSSDSSTSQRSTKRNRLSGLADAAEERQRKFEENRLKIKKKQAELDKKNPFKNDSDVQKSNKTEVNRLFNDGVISEETFNGLTADIDAKLKLSSKEETEAQLQQDLQGVSAKIPGSIVVGAEETKAAIDQTISVIQQGIKPLVVPIIFKEQGSTQLQQELQTEVLKRGRVR